VLYFLLVWLNEDEYEIELWCADYTLFFLWLMSSKYKVKYTSICIARLCANGSNTLRYGSHSVTCKQHHIWRAVKTNDVVDLLPFLSGFCQSDGFLKCAVTPFILDLNHKLGQNWYRKTEVVWIMLHSLFLYAYWQYSCSVEHLRSICRLENTLPLSYHTQRQPNLRPTCHCSFCI